jgi:hypothetical protein
MQALDVQPTNPTPYTPAGGAYNFNPTPGAGGLPALSGLNNRMNPMAQELQGMGRGDDKMLVHMTPDEVNDLQGLAMQTGTTMTINPYTGLPEAGLLGKVFKKLLPALAGAGLMFIPGVNAIAAAGIVGGGSTLLTGSLKKGLMAGLSAYGGASLARGLGAGVQAAKTATGTGIGAGTGSGISATKDAVGMGSRFGAGFGGAPGVSNFAPGVGGTGLTSAVNTANTVGAAAKTGLAAIPGNVANAARAGLPAGILSKAAPYAAGLGLINTASEVDRAIQQGRGGGPETEQSSWVNEGPYMPTRRVLKPRLTGPDGMGEIDYFEEPEFGGYMTASGQVRGLPPGYVQPQYPGYAEGGSTRKGLTLSDVPASPTVKDPAKPVSERTSMIEYAGDEGAAKAMTIGFVNSVTGKPTQFSGTSAATMKPGTIQDFSAFGGPSLRLGEDLRWYTTEPLKAPTTTRGTGTNTASNVTTTPSGYGVYTLPDRYTPSFTKVEDFVTEKVNPYTGGTEQTQKLDEYIKSYQTSPGQLKSTSLGYAPGQSPSERNRAYALELARREEEREKAEAATRTSTGANPNTFTGGFYYNPADGQTYNNPNFTGPVFNPVTGTFVATPGGFNGPGRARGGSIHMDDGSFVVDARTVSELGNGSSNAGIEFLERLGGRAVRGPGDGVSDSVPANIGGVQKARVARDEVIFPAKAVKRLGGAKKLYALMDKAHKARKKAGRGSDTKLRKGLGAL